MASIYQDESLLNGLRDAIQAFLTVTPEGFELWSSYQGTLLRRVHVSLGEVIHSADPRRVHPPLIIHPESDALNSSDLYIDADGIHVGIGFFKRLTFHLLQFSHFLMENFIWQISPPMGDAPPLADVVTLEDFPAQALTFNAASLVHGAISDTGFSRSIGSLLLDWLQDLTFSGTADPKTLQAGLSRRVIKPANRDLLMYNRRFEEDPLSLLQAYEDHELLPYLQRLVWQLLLDAVYFLLAHELAHGLLGHTQRGADLTAAESQTQETETDELALRIVHQVPGFMPPSLLMLFAFCSGQEEDLPLNEMDHPFSHARLLHLAAALLHEPEGEDLRLNVNAGMAFLTTPLTLVTLRTLWEDGFAETSELALHQYADMDFNAHLLFYLERPPRDVPLADGGRQNAFMICLHTFQVDLLLRDRIHPEVVYNRGQVRLRPGGVPDDMMFDSSSDRVLARLHVRIPTPADWWLAHPDAEAVIENVEQAPEPLEELKDDQGNFRHNLNYQVSVEFDHQKFLQALPETSQEADPVTRHMVLLAARRFIELDAAKLALFYYNWLYRSGDPLLQYPDQVDICQALLENHQWEGVEVVAGRALEQAGGRLLPGFHIYLAACLKQRGELQEAMEHVFIEQFGVGDFGKFISFARLAYAEIVQLPGDPVMDRLRRFHRHYAAAQKAEEEHSEKALALFRKARRAIQQACRLAQKDYLFLREYAAEVELDICWLEGGSFETPNQLFEAICAREPWFVPARIQLARIALLQADGDRARTLWMETRRQTPFLHNMVFDFREALDQPNPKVVFTSRPVDGAQVSPGSPNQE
jgi:hypothetical protein